MDEFDIKILSLVQRSNRLTAEQLAEGVGMSPSAVQRRLRRLREDKIIEGDVAIISPEAIGRTLTAIIEVSLHSDHPQILSEFKRLMLATDEVMQCYYVTGEADFVLIVTAKDTQDYDSFTRRLFGENTHVRRFKTTVVIQRVKTGLIVPLE